VRASLRHLTLEALSESETREGREAAAARAKAQARLEELRQKKVGWIEYRVLYHQGGCILVV
jgi:hypothetical protein